jgi:hypothetical protein
MNGGVILGRKSIDMLATFFSNGKPEPHRFKITNDDGSESVIKIERILQRDQNNHAGNRMICYRCETKQHDVLIPVELRYEVDTCRWYLYV